MTNFTDNSVPGKHFKMVGERGIFHFCQPTNTTSEPQAHLTRVKNNVGQAGAIESYFEHGVIV
ncbi:phosphatase [Histoplasma capsulatum]|uniref:Phosphatase n=1 Tax=Ajellomyces capsulatus TaxID=5037 RepID=A0A8A1MHD4_AJECA|nr:phosphatase [Histoplasma capsulatum]